MRQPEVIPIGRGMCRITIRSASKRRRLAAVPGVMVDGDRVIFPNEMTGAIIGSLKCWTRRRPRRETQMALEL